MNAVELREMLHSFDKAMDDSKVPGTTRTEVMNRLIWGHPDGYRAVRYISPDARQEPLIPFETVSAEES